MIEKHIMEKPWARDPRNFYVYYYLRSNANYTSEESNDILIKRGQILTSLREISKKTYIPKNTVDRILKTLVKHHEISIDRNGNSTIITILNYEIDDKKEGVGTPFGTPEIEESGTPLQSDFQAQIDDKMIEKTDNVGHPKTDNVGHLSGHLPNVTLLSYYLLTNINNITNTACVRDKASFKKSQEKKYLWTFTIPPEELTGPIQHDIGIYRRETLKNMFKNWPIGKRPSVRIEFINQIESKIELRSYEIINLFEKSFVKTHNRILESLKLKWNNEPEVLVDENQMKKQIAQFWPSFENYLKDPFKDLSDESSERLQILVVTSNS
jgi:hypothetical protein|tara:strand:- start:1314 stop:2288 length:975 start_codon:yes stop_codon:yes gene_type:complete